MDLKPMSWVDNMCNGIESFCEKVEETVYQDTIKYVEDQMRRVGVSVKKFYSDVVQDFLPQSSSDRIEENSPTTVMHHADVKVNEESNTEAKQMANCTEDTSDDNNDTCSINKSFEATSHHSHGSFNEQCAIEDFEGRCGELDIYSTKKLDVEERCECKSPSCRSYINASVTKGLVEKLSQSEVLLSKTKPLCGLPNLSRSEVILSKTKLLCGLANLGLKSASVGEASDIEADEVGIAEQLIEGNGIVGPLNECKQVELLSGNSSLDFDETSNSLVGGETENCDANNQGFLLDTQLKLKLGESCVLVEGNKCSAKKTFGQEQKSYKEKIRDVFSPKRWSKGKQDEEQIAVWYEPQNRIFDELSSTSPKYLVTRQDLEPYKSFDSEWELI